ncbi:flagellar biosynthetic protein FliR [Bombella saccharophila]|uniref:Flagellar biosynthetic protein FliR n=1 Tax=Bombella saccharophila TaxID=2967338 RepID=A0ABT3W7A5_9PROT|nr:flagellar biosynthetic protein FliR [Bombella saccharophila]MCX5614964.1 flagellar biosynthetic protein FliR [Bombella saccharophila]
MNSLADFFGSPDLAAANGSMAILTGMFVIILCRVSAVVMLAPGLGEMGAPARIRAGLCLGITVALLPVLQQRLIAVSGEALRMPAMMLKLIAGELLCGFFLGMMARLLSLSLAIAGQIIAVFTGMASVIQTDSQLGASSTAVSHMASTLAPIILFATGLYALPLLAISGSYTLFPAGHITSLIIGDMTADMTRAVSTSFLIAMQLAAPYILLGTLWPAMLGVLNRLMPSIQVYSLAIPAQILGGILLMALLIQILTSTWAEKMQLYLSTLPGLGLSSP